MKIKQPWRCLFCFQSTHRLCHVALLLLCFRVTDTLKPACSISCLYMRACVWWRGPNMHVSVLHVAKSRSTLQYILTQSITAVKCCQLACVGSDHSVRSWNTLMGISDKYKTLICVRLASNSTTYSCIFIRKWSPDIHSLHSSLRSGFWPDTSKPSVI